MAGTNGNLSNSKITGTLQLAGEADIVWHEENSEEATGGTSRFWKFVVSEWVLIDSLKGIDWKFVDYSPFNV